MNKYFLPVLTILYFLLCSFTYGQDSKCSYCGEIINGKYIVAEGNKYHPDHFRCAICNKPINGSYSKDGQSYYHPECFRENKIQKCAICNKPLIGHYVIDAFLNKYHMEHEKEFSKCSNCGRLICPSLTNGGKSYGDNRSMCNICYKDAIFSDGDYSRLLNKVARSLGYIGLDVNSDKIKTQGVNLYDLKKLAGNKGYQEDLQGYCKSEKWGNSNTKPGFTHFIYVLNGMPSITTESVIAHELMHSWIFENTKKEPIGADNEGSCNYISFLYLKTAGDPNASFLIRKLEENPDPIYGKGFLNIRTKFSSKPLSSLLEYIKNLN